MNAPTDLTLFRDALRDALEREFLRPGDVLYRNSDGTVTVNEMLEHLAKHTYVADSFLRAAAAAVVSMMAAEARRPR